MSLDISVREKGGVTIVDLEGKATLGPDNDVFERNLRKIVADGARNVLLNLAALKQVDSSGIGTIASTFVSLSRQGGNLKLLCPRGRVRAALDVMKWFDYIDTFEDEAQALASFRLDQKSAAP